MKNIEVIQSLSLLLILPVKLTITGYHLSVQSFSH